MKSDGFVRRYVPMKYDGCQGRYNLVKYDEREGWYDPVKSGGCVRRNPLMTSDVLEGKAYSYEF